MLKLPPIKLELDEDEPALRRKISSLLGIGDAELIGYQLLRQSIDARQRGRVYLIYTVAAEVRDEERVLGGSRRQAISRFTAEAYRYVQPGVEPLTDPPVIVGMGPAGLFAGLILSRMGYRPLLLERGEDVETRARRVSNFWNGGEFDGESNVQFGEGGAGAFSDGKLTTLIRDPRCHQVLHELVAAGAPEEALFLNKPHIGTDRLRAVVSHLRSAIIANGGTVRFRARVTGLVQSGGEIRGVLVNASERIDAGVVLLAAGHSARDTYTMLHEQGVVLTPKPFSIGVRIEHPQSLIDTAQFGLQAGHPRLGPADYKLAYHAPGGRSAYTFCMCPGGRVIAAASEAGGVVTNGMSSYLRDEINANSALLVGVTPDDFGSTHPLAGVVWQRRWEQLAFAAGRGGFQAPVQLVGDFLAGRPSRGFGPVTPTYRPGTVFADLATCLPSYAAATIREAIPFFERRVRGFAMPEAVLTGVETRSSAPVRINRDEQLMASLRGLYPVGEGSGYAGGIMSSAVDGIRAAEKVASRYKPF
ncbi:MAG: FAD-dependent protein [Thermacetogeniaceae bacterium]